MQPTRSILLAEDDAAARAFLTDNLTADGYEVLGADAKAAWEVGRLGHLWRFAQAYRLSGDAAWAQAWLECVRHFRESNPAGFGVQWSCAMEVSLRAMTVALSFGLVQREVDAGLLLDFLEEHDLELPTHAQARIERLRVKPDFTDATHHLVVFVDGPPHADAAISAARTGANTLVR